MLDGAALAVSEYLPGRDAERALADLGDEQARVMVRDLGRAVARLHRFPVPGFGTDVTGVGRPAPSWASAVRVHVGRLRVALDGESVVTSGTRALAEAGLSLLVEAAQAVSPVVVAGAVHADL